MILNYKDFFSQNFICDKKQIKHNAKMFYTKYKIFSIIQLLIYIISFFILWMYINKHSLIYLILFIILLIINYGINILSKKYINNKKQDKDIIILLRKNKYIEFKETIDKIIENNPKEIRFSIENNIYKIIYKNKSQSKTINYIINYPLNIIESQNSDISMELVEQNENQLDFMLNIYVKNKKDKLYGKLKIIK